MSAWPTRQQPITRSRPRCRRSMIRMTDAVSPVAFTS
jgi:hypothetical protein